MNFPWHVTSVGLFFAALIAKAANDPGVILTPKPEPAPRINGPTVYGARPSHPFLYRIPAQGDRPMKFSVRGLPDTLQVDADSGVISGITPGRGTYELSLVARNSNGWSQRKFRLVSGDTLSLTPSMGWNSWYAHYNRITDKMMREAADVMISRGMADVGYQYINVDDCWMNAEKSADPKRAGPFRDENGNIQPNSYFPDMKALADYIHSKGLKAGLYTSPGPQTCAHCAGTYEHEAQDAKQFADWGFDFLKYDWCSYGHIAPKPAPLPELKKPYVMMGALLQRQNRDILFNLCQYGMGNVWEWGAEVGGQSWRTAGDLGFELNKIFAVALKNSEHRKWQKPGAWNDPDYIQIGYIGNARGAGLPQPCPLTPTEQYSFMSLWCLMGSPLFYSGDMSKLDEFTLNVLCNPEVIDIDQDALGECAQVQRLTPTTFLMAKNLEDGSHAIGLCNAGESEAFMTANWSVLGFGDRRHVRDVWRQTDIGTMQQFDTIVPPHGVALVRVN
jgi:alpha-galactosidase